MASFNGDDDTATPFFQLTSRSKEIATSSPAGGDLQVSLLDKVVTRLRPYPPRRRAKPEET